MKCFFYPLCVLLLSFIACNSKHSKTDFFEEGNIYEYQLDGKNVFLEKLTNKDSDGFYTFYLFAKSKVDFKDSIAFTNYLFNDWQTEKSNDFGIVHINKSKIDDAIHNKTMSYFMKKIDF